MQRDELGDLRAFLAVAEERSFTKAAAKLGVSQPALSYTIRQLERGSGSACWPAPLGVSRRPKPANVSLRPLGRCSKGSLPG